MEFICIIIQISAHRTGQIMFDTAQNLRSFEFQDSKNGLQRSNSEDSIFIEQTHTKNSWRKEKNNKAFTKYETHNVYVRVCLSNLEQQIRLYEWRRNCPPNVVHIEDFIIVSRGTVFNPNALIKVTLDNSLQPICFVEESFTLTRAIYLMKQILNGLKTLIQNFSPFVFTDRMITIGQGGIPKIWMMDSLELNPQNQLKSQKQYNKCSEKNCMKSLTKIIQTKCLKTRLSFQFFNQIKNVDSVEAAFNAIDKFQQQNKIFCPVKLKVSMSTNPQSSLGFSMKSSKRRRKSKKKSEQCCEDIRYSMRSINSSFGLDDPDEKKGLSIETKEHIRLSLGNNWAYQGGQQFLGGKKILKKNSETAARSNFKQENSQQASFVFSQTFKEDESAVIKSIPKLLTPASKISWFSSKSNISLEQKMEMIQLQIPAKIPEQLEASHQMSIKINNKIMDKNQNQLLQSQIMDVQQVNPFHIISKNGWSLQVRELNESPLKESYIHGKDIVREKSHQRKLSKLQKLGKQLVESVCQDSD